jgi:ribonuclease HI
MTQGWVNRWKANGWKRNKKERALNVDLWERLLAASRPHEVKFIWVKGHAGLRENERCDRLSTGAMQKSNLPSDEGYSA